MNQHVTELIQAILDAVGGFTADLTNILAGVTSIDGKLDVNLSTRGSEATLATRATEATVATLGTEATLAAQSAKIVAPGTWTPATTAAPAHSGIITAAATTVRSVMLASSGANDVYIQFFDSPTVPIDTTVPRIPSVWLPAGQTAVIQLGAMACANGFSWSSSSTANQKTITAHAEFQVSAEIG